MDLPLVDRRQITGGSQLICRIGLSERGADRSCLGMPPASTVAMGRRKYRVGQSRRVEQMWRARPSPDQVVAAPTGQILRHSATTEPLSP